MWLFSFQKEELRPVGPHNLQRGTNRKLEVACILLIGMKIDELGWLWIATVSQEQQTCPNLHFMEQQMGSPVREIFAYELNIQIEDFHTSHN